MTILQSFSIWTELVNSDRIFFSSKNIYHDLPELSPMQVRRLNQPSLQSHSKVEPYLVSHMSGAAFGTGLSVVKTKATFRQMEIWVPISPVFKIASKPFCGYGV